MKIIEKSFTPDGIEIQLEDWSEHNTDNYPDLCGLTIGAYPIAKGSSGYGWIQCGKKFRLAISMNQYKNYTNDDVRSDFECLKNGKKSLADLKQYFFNGGKDAYFLGIE